MGGTEFGTTSDYAGVRPSPGAARSDWPDAVESFNASLRWHIPAPGDGRTPGKAVSPRIGIGEPEFVMIRGIRVKRHFLR